MLPPLRPGVSACSLLLAVLCTCLLRRLRLLRTSCCCRCGAAQLLPLLACLLRALPLLLLLLRLLALSSLSCHPLPLLLLACRLAPIRCLALIPSCRRRRRLLSPLRLQRRRLLPLQPPHMGRCGSQYALVEGVCQAQLLASSKAGALHFILH